ncbi:hypothetical protein QFC22_003500 [Naganishia vaughanmartiniae]|uniref:Uncharacterized protein n=1 Tax=Naganishia vaughanmartiniae TaxID=1424756 RepID=A0ACC2X6G2_9TREE|nr:hypothetical protein QFC22_003500 [Naganishia vaughanmartiniae]
MLHHLIYHLRPVHSPDNPTTTRSHPAQSQISLLSRRFPSSPRLLILQALHLESLGKYTSARIVYHCLLGRREGVEVPRLALGGLDGVDAAAAAGVAEKDGAEQGQGRAGLGIARGEADDGTEGVKVMALWKGEPDECFVTAHQRLITLALYPPPSSSTTTTTATTVSYKTTPTPSSEGIKAALPLLTRYLETFHSDPEAWSLLADLYVVSSAGLAPSLTQRTTSSGWGIDALFANGTTHLLTLQTTLQTSVSKPSLTDASYIPQALQSLAQQILLEPWSARPLIRFGELYLLSNDIETAFRTLLRSVEMTSEPFVGGNDPRAGDEAVRTEYERVVAGSEKGWRQVMRVGGWKTRVWWDLALYLPCIAPLAYIGLRAR